MIEETVSINPNPTQTLTQTAPAPNGTSNLNTVQNTFNEKPSTGKTYLILRFTWQ